MSAFPNLPIINLTTLPGPANATPAPGVALGPASSLGPAPGPGVATAPGLASESFSSGTGTGCDACKLVSNAGEVGCAGDYTVASNVDECATGGTICEGFGGAPSVTCCAPDADVLTLEPAGELKLPANTWCHAMHAHATLELCFKAVQQHVPINSRTPTLACGESNGPALSSPEVPKQPASWLAMVVVSNATNPAKLMQSLTGGCHGKATEGC